MSTNEMVRSGAVTLEAKVAESLVIRGDVSGLGPKERIALYLAACSDHGLNPRAQPFSFLRLNGKEVMYANKGCGDQLAAIHKLNREIIDGPKLIDLGGTKLVYCVARVTHPSGRFETATATVPFTDPVNVLMKCETKGKRRATLSLLGLAMLDETEVDDIDERAKGARTTPSVEELSVVHPTVTTEPQDAPTGDGGPHVNDLDSDAQEEAEEGPSSRAYGRFVDTIAGLPTLTAIHNAYNELVTGLHEEGNEPSVFLDGADGALERARQRAEVLRHRLVSAELRQALASRPLAELLDTQVSIVPGDEALKKAALLWIASKPAVAQLDQAHRKTPWYALVRRYSGASQATDVKRANVALQEAVKMLDKPTPPTGTDAPKVGASTPANGDGGAAAATSTSAAARAQVEAFREHLHNVRRDGDDKGAGHVAGSWWKRAAGYRALGIHAECLAVVLDELTARGVTEAHPWLDSIGEKNGYVKRPARAA